MKRTAFLALLSGTAVAQEYPPTLPGKEEPPKRLPNGTLQSEAILKEEHKKLVEEAGKLTSLAKEIEESIEKNPHQVLNLALLKKIEEVEKLAKRMRGRYQR
jgi:hypothetical protein